jgi:putative ABC transport system permease protein
MSNLLYSLRTLRRSPAFTATVTVTLALGIGASTAVFSAADRLLLRSLPYPEAGRLVALHETQTGKGFRPVSLANLLDWRTQSTSFDGVAGFMTRSFGLRDAGSPVSVVMVGMVTSDLFRVLGSGPHLGRTFTEREEFDGAPLIVLTDELWARQFHRTPDIVGRTVQLNEQPYEAIGILPPDFVFPAAGTRVDAYIPISHRDYGSRAAKPLQAVARLKPGATFASARAELSAIGARLATAWPEDNARGGAGMESLDNAWKGSLRRPLLLLTIAALLLLAIVCTNVVNLILARSLARAHEMEIRTALGAGKADVLRQLLAEALLLCAAGGALGLLLAGAILRGLPIVLRQPVEGLAIDGRALAFASAVCLLVTLLCGLAPALSTRRHRHPFRLRQSLVVGQIALSLVLLLSAGAFLRVFLKLVNRNPGFDSSHVMYFGFGLPEGRYTDRQMVDFHAKLRARLAEIPGVECAGAVWRLPLNGRNSTTSFQFEGAGLPTSEWSAVAFNSVDPAYFSALRIPLLAGRSLAWDTDRLDRPPALIVNRAFEQAYASDGGLIGKRVQLRFWTDLAPKNQLWQIVGVVGDTYQAGLDQSIRPQIYLPISQTGLDGGDYVIRTTRTDSEFSAAVAAAVRSVDPNLERINLRRLDNWVRDSLGDRRLPAILTTLFAAIGLSLTALGLYGTIALEVAQRRKEMAIRVAVGASHASIAVLILKRGLALTSVGSVVGALGFIAVGRAIESQLYEVAPSDPANAAVVVVILVASAICACLRPAWNTLRQAPITVLREM